MQFASQMLARIRGLVAPGMGGRQPGPQAQAAIGGEVARMAATLESSPLRDLIDAIQVAAGGEGDSFFRAVDRAKADYARAVGDDLQQAITGLKMANLLVARYEYDRGHVVTVAQPISFMLDTANQCQLGCPSCTNTFNRDYAEATFNPWPRGLLSADRFDAFIRSVGVAAFAGHFYNNNEPFLNKRTAEYLRVANDLQIETFVSSNLSFSKMDHEAIVRSGLNELMVAADGLTQASYEKYRKGGRLEWVFANVRGIAEAKKRLGMATPTLRWQWLTFAHNVHEVEAAIPFAREVGFDTFNLATPHQVSQDDPNVHAVEYEGPAEHRAVLFNPRQPGSFEADLEPYRDLIEGKLGDSLHRRWVAAGGPEAMPKEPDSGDRCDWLHMAVISDAMGRVVPCCLGDRKGKGSFVFATVDEDHENLMNSPRYRQARTMIAQPDSFATDIAGRADRDLLRCETCTIRPTPQIGLGAVNSYFVYAGNPAIDALPGEVRTSLVDWSRHQQIPPQRRAFALAFEGEVLEPRYHNMAPGPLPGRFLGFAAGELESLDQVQRVTIQLRLDAARDLARPSLRAVLADAGGGQLAVAGSEPLEPLAEGGSRWHRLSITLPYQPGRRDLAVTVLDGGSAVETANLLQLRSSLGGVLRVVSVDPAGQ